MEEHEPLLSPTWPQKRVSRLRLLLQQHRGKLELLGVFISLALILIVALPVRSLADRIIGESRGVLRNPLKPYVNGSWNRPWPDSQCVASFLREHHWEKGPVVDPSTAVVNFQISGCPIYELPDETIYHQAWFGEWQPFLQLTIDSFLATQWIDIDRVTWAPSPVIDWLPTPPDYRNKSSPVLYFWHNTDLPSEIISRYTSNDSPYRKYIVFKRFDGDEMIKSSCFASQWTDELKDRLSIAHVSDLLRVILLERYGGAWVDVDVVFVRQLHPLWQIGPSAAYSLSKHLWNNHLLIVGPKGSHASKTLYEAACAIPLDPLKWPFKVFDPAMPDWQHNDGLLRICDTVFACGFQGFPAELLDGVAWHPKPLQPCQNKTDLATADSLWRLYTWHHRIDDYNVEECLAEGAQTAMKHTQTRIDNILRSRCWKDMHALENDITRDRTWPNETYWWC